MSNPVVSGFRGLGRFSGRDRRSRFWPYAGVVIALVYLLAAIFGTAAMAPAMAEMTEYAAAHPEHATVTAGPGGYSVSIDADAPNVPMPDFGPFFMTMTGVVLLSIILLAAAVSRRLHDTGRSGFWGLAPLPFLLGALLVMPALIRSVSESESPDMRLFGLLFINNSLYLLSLVGLFVLLCLPTRAGPNRHGEADAR